MAGALPGVRRGKSSKQMIQDRHGQGQKTDKPTVCSRSSDPYTSMTYSIKNLLKTIIKKNAIANLVPDGSKLGSGYAFFKIGLNREQIRSKR